MAASGVAQCVGEYGKWSVEIVTPSVGWMIVYSYVSRTVSVAAQQAQVQKGVHWSSCWCADPGCDTSADATTAADS